MRAPSWILAAVVLAAVGIQPAMAMTTVSLVGAGDWSSSSVIPDPGNMSSKLGLGGGMLLSFSLAPIFRLEIGGLYITRKTDFTDYSSPTTEQSNGLQIPVLLRFHFNRYISIGAGGYYTRFVGQLKSTNDSTGISSQASYGDSGLTSGEFGLVGSVALHFPLTYTTDFTIDGRYDYGLSNVVSDATLADANSEKFRDIQVLTGFTFHLMR